MTRTLNVLLDVACVTLAFLCLFFSISKNLFFWFYGDELIANQIYHNAGGYFSCIKTYYLQTTINRLSADVGICSMAGSSTFFDSPFIGWVLARLFFYLLIPCSIAYLLKRIGRLQYKYGLTAAFLMCSFAFYMISSHVQHLFGLDLAIYAVATLTFFVLLGLFPRILESKQSFILFSVFYALNLNSHEVMLVVSSVFLPLYVWCRYCYFRGEKKPLTFRVTAEGVLKDRKIWLLLAIYISSVLITVLAPGVAIRQTIWPSVGTFWDGLSYMLLSIEEVFHVLARFYVVIIIVFIMGCLSGRLAPKNLYNKKYFLVFIWVPPFIYLIVTGFLIGLTPSLQTGHTFASSIIPIKTLFAGRVSSQSIFLGGGLAIRQAIFIYTSIILNIFLVGFYVSNYQKKMEHLAKIRWFYRAALASIIMLAFLFHPAGLGSIRVIKTLFGNKVNLSHYDPIKEKQSNPEKSIIYRILGHKRILRKITNIIFPYKLVNLDEHESNVVNILVDKYFRSRRGKSVSTAIALLPAVLLGPGYAVMTGPDWRLILYPLYHVYSDPCVSFLGAPKKSAFCFNTFKKQKKIIKSPDEIYFSTLVGVKIISKSKCSRYSEMPVIGKHYAASQKIELLPGLYYFIFEFQTPPPLSLYILGKYKNILISDEEPVKINESRKGNKKDSLVLLFRQTEQWPGMKKLRLVIDNKIKQRIQFRWQPSFSTNIEGHQKARIDISSPVYKGKKNHYFGVCESRYGMVKDIKSIRLKILFDSAINNKS